MFSPEIQDRRWSKCAFRAFIGSIAATTLLAFAIGAMKGYFVKNLSSFPSYELITTFIASLRVLAENLTVATAILFVGAKFFETRTILAIGFDKLDAAKMTCKGPDENNTVWIGRRCGSRFEAEAIAAVLEDQLKKSGRT